jgi:Fic family protein
MEGTMTDHVPPRITDTRYLRAYQSAWNEDDGPASRWERFAARGDRPEATFAFQASAVYSSNIEGNRIDLNSYLRSKTRGTPPPRPKETEEIDALVDAYAFAEANPLGEKTALEAHRILSAGLLGESDRGRYRSGRMFVYGREGIIYAAVEPEHVPGLMGRYFGDLTALCEAGMDATAAFYHAALLHLVLAHIHPFEDGNGRAARLLEKWFLATKLGGAAWTIPSEAHYWEHRPDYYRTLRLGPTYYDLDYDRCLPFLQLLPGSLLPAP